MPRGPLYNADYRPQFSGHETFPLRYGWLKKAFDAVGEADSPEAAKAAFTREDAIARFGVGKNMVAAIRHWAVATGILSESRDGKQISPTPLGRLLFGENGIDPYMEHPASLWLIHWQLAGHPEKTTWFWAFNHFPLASFERDALLKSLEQLSEDRAWKRIATGTLKRDVDCFLRSYVARLSVGKQGHEDLMESPLTELGLIKAVGKRDGFQFERGPKPSLTMGAFTYALVDFWSRHSSARTISFEAMAHEAGAPGRVFLLDEDDLVERLARLDDASKGAFRWSETAGLRQVIREQDLDLSLARKVIREEIANAYRRKAT